jgi:hypothetical protein
VPPANKIVIDQDYIGGLRDFLNTLWLGIPTLEAGNNPNNAGSRSGVRLNDLVVKGGADTFSEAKSAAEKIKATGVELHTKFEGIELNLGKTVQNLTYMVDLSTDTEIRNLNAVQAASMLNGGSGSSPITSGGTPTTSGGTPPTTTGSGATTTP